MVLEARKLAKNLRQDAEFAVGFTSSTEEYRSTVKALDGLGYDEAAQEVYGCTYPEWKKRHQKKASEEQMKIYNENTHLHAVHDKDLLKKAVDGGDEMLLNYCQKYLSEKVMTRLKAGAFSNLCIHLRERSDVIQNVELMTISGFCRNCLAKWMVVEARKISDETRPLALEGSEKEQLVQALDSFGYDQAAQVVYGCTYPEWKKRYQTKATEEQMERYSGSSHLHAKHDLSLLATRVLNDHSSAIESNAKEHIQNTHHNTKGQHKHPLLSDVCCEDVDNFQPTERPCEKFSSIVSPPNDNMKLKIAILTVSDRAASKSYKTGDLSGPAVEQAIIEHLNHLKAALSEQNVSVTNVEKDIVPDEISDIKQKLLLWSGKSNESMRGCPCDLIFTTGGTGFATRDVTPEATLSVVDRECQGLMSWASMELTAIQPLATLSRAAAGLCGNTLIVNLPGNPAGAAQVVELLFPLLLHAIADIRKN
mmetsp:Transcript_18092/g.37914  ORF Transcript_18092/g.37914 Transcript_18092/m.37914 type:complete len:479 (+) Transcript_18092:527-1963(+)